MENSVRSVKYPEVEVVFSGQDGNVFNLLGICRRALLKAGHPREVFDEFFKEVTRKGYDWAIQTAMRWFNVL